MALLELRGLSAEVDGKPALSGLSLSVDPGESRPVPSALSKVLMGHPSCRVTAGSIVLDGADITVLSTAERARRGLLPSFPRPPALPGVTVASFLRAALAARTRGLKDFRKLLREKLAVLKLDEGFGSRRLDAALSDAERTGFEALQRELLKPSLIIEDGVLRAL
ncbi:MAG: hypothetical protein HYZ75_07430 [Elusimicrobia bacterium]|nr:hypothetical protein [Elusimicrobiota bacterium]